MGFFNNMALLYICMIIACMFYNPYLVIGEGKTGSTLDFFNTGIDVNENPYVINGLSNSTNQANAQLLQEGRDGTNDNSPLQTFLYVIDTTWNAIKWIALFSLNLFAPILLLINMGAPYYIVFTIGVPLVFMGLLSIIMIIRGYN